MSETTYPTTNITGNPNAARQGNGPPPLPDVAHVARLPEQPNPVMVTYGTPPSPTPEDIERARQARLRPADKSAKSILAALANLAEDAASARARAAGWQRKAEELLQDGGSIADIQTARSKASAAGVEVEQLAVMEASLRISLAQAEATEATELEALTARVPALTDWVEGWRKWALNDYPKLARKIADGLAMEAMAEKAMQQLREAASRVPGVKMPAPLPLVNAGAHGEAFRYRASLPGTDVQPLARWAPPPRIQY